MEFANNFDIYIKAIQKNDLNTARNYYRDEYLNKLDENDMTGFMHACNLGHVEIVKFFFQKNINFEYACPYNEWRPLHWAVGNGYEIVGKLLLDRGADKESRTSKGLHPLHCAAIANHIDAVRLLLIYGANIEARNLKNETAVQMALNNDCDECTLFFTKWTEYPKIYNIIRQNQIDIFKDRFLKERVLVKEEQTQLTVLDLAVQCRAKEFLEFIFLENIDENDVLTALSHTLDQWRMTPDNFRTQFLLYRSILFENKDEFAEMATVTNVNATWSLTGDTFLEICCRHNRSIFVGPLLQMLLDVDESWEKAVNVATELDYEGIANIIKSRKAYINNRIKASYNRLHIAVQDNNVAVIKYILNNHLIDPNKNEAVLGTPLCLALSLGHMDSVTALLTYDIDINKTNKYNQTPLHLALENKIFCDSQTFIDNNSNVDHKDCYGFTPLHLAVINCDDNLCQQLIDRGADVLLYLQIQQAKHMENLFMSAMIPMSNLENPLTLCLKLHRTILPSLIAKLTAQMCNLLLASDDISLLHISSKLLIPSTTQILITKGSNVNLVNKNGNTPLHCAFLESTDNSWEMEGFVETIGILIAGGADINICNCDGISAFKCALDTNSRSTLNVVLHQCNHVNVDMDDVFKLYQRQWPDLLKIILDLQDNHFKKDMITSYITESQLELIEFILELSSEQFVASILDESLCLAASLGKEDIFERFLQYNIVESQLLTNGETALTYLILYTDEKYSLKLCKSDQAYIYLDMKNNLSQTALHVAAIRGYLKLFKHLVINCALVEEQYEGVTPLEKLMTTVGNTNDKQKIEKLETIIKIMIKQGFDIYKISNCGTTFISMCSNMPLKIRLENYFVKAGKKISITPEPVDEEKNQCEICLSAIINCQFGCGHPFCKDCAIKVNICPKCRKPVKQIIPLFI